MLAELCRTLDAADIVFSAAVIGAGTAFFQAVVAHGHEGVMVKHLNSVYRPGKHSPKWKKMRVTADGPDDGSQTIHLLGAPVALIVALVEAAPNSRETCRSAKNSAGNAGRCVGLGPRMDGIQLP